MHSFRKNFREYVLGVIGVNESNLSPAFCICDLVERGEEPHEGDVRAAYSDLRKVRALFNTYVRGCKSSTRGKIIAECAAEQLTKSLALLHDYATGQGYDVALKQ